MLQHSVVEEALNDLLKCGQIQVKDINRTTQFYFIPLDVHLKRSENPEEEVKENGDHVFALQFQKIRSQV
jgi:hypothetical protein